MLTREARPDGEEVDVGAQLATIPESWEASCLETDVISYVEESLLDVAAYAAMNADSTQYCSAFPLLPTTTAVDISSATSAPLPTCSGQNLCPAMASKPKAECGILNLPGQQFLVEQVAPVRPAADCSHL